MKLQKNRSGGCRILIDRKTDERTDRQTDVSKLKDVSHNFANASETILYEGRQHNIEWFQSNVAESIT